MKSQHNTLTENEVTSHKHKLILPRISWHNRRVEKVIGTTKDISTIWKHSDVGLQLICYS